MHGLGNDFVVFDAISQRIVLDETQLRAIADRRFGVGCDQILLVEPPRHPDTEFHYRIYNADGSEVEQCGNGARCFARFVHDKQLTRSRDIAVGTAGGNIVLHLEDHDRVRVNMGPAHLAPAEIPFEASRQAISYPLEVDGERFEIGAVSMGNPHAVFLVEDVDLVERHGAVLERHPFFPERANISVAQVLSPGHLRLRTWERGAGLTRACGTAACASAVAAVRRGLTDRKVTVSLPGGDLVIEWREGDGHVLMTGPYALDFEGTLPPGVFAAAEPEGQGV